MRPSLNCRVLILHSLHIPFHDMIQNKKCQGLFQPHQSVASSPGTMYDASQSQREIYIYILFFLSICFARFLKRTKIFDGKKRLLFVALLFGVHRCGPGYDGATPMKELCVEPIEMFLFRIPFQDSRILNWHDSY